MKIGLFLMTKKGFLVLENLLESKFHNIISFVCIGTDKQMEEDYSDVMKLLCEKYSIPFFYRKDIKNNFYYSDYNVAISWRWMLDVPNLIVLHDSILPRYRGFAPLVNMLINGEDFLGVTALFATKEYDKGDIIFQEKIKIKYPIKISDAIDLISQLYCNIVSQICNDVQNRKLTATKQDDTNATYSLWLGNDDYFIDWNWSADKIKRKIDACGFPYTSAKCQLDNELICIHDAEVITDLIIENRVVGKNIFLIDKKPVIVCGSGLLKITEATYQKNNKDVFPLSKFRIILK